MDKDQLVMISEWMVNGNINEFVKVHWEANPFKLVRSLSCRLPWFLPTIPPDSSEGSLTG